MTQRPDTESRVLIATIALIIILSWINGGLSIWEGATRVLP